ncbi:protein tyrosine phosphatase [Polynucleobacter sp. AP-Jannik-300A-C4]|uniref:protein tyrosine phosphatase n=1 Tax=Polynucleobacter sp. AP-Jannik-300A-C4 TaxID=2576928 RepID=UPI001BFE4F37|nr:protein tyrosine phosphatase [Polynucleobacter sp. AP-Jannik-300A-C4]QWE21875.1 protein tyrosine phosphatase [Polynucleobacter sp. AP-Jannik-300A-C4]
MPARFVKLFFATLISASIGLSPLSVMAADPVTAPAPLAAPAAAPAAQAEKASKKGAKKSLKDKKAEKKSKKKSKKKAKAVQQPATPQPTAPQQ